MANQLNPDLGFHHIGLKVKDIEKSIKFYEEALGMTPFITWGEGDKRIQMMDFGDGGILELFAGGSDELHRENVWQHFAFRVNSVDTAYANALAHGAIPLTAPKSVPLNSKPTDVTIRVAFVEGPDGEQLEFFKIVEVK